MFKQLRILKFDLFDNSMKEKRRKMLWINKEKKVIGSKKILFVSDYE